MSILTPAILKVLLPTLARSEEWVVALSGATDHFGIASRERLAAFLAQVAQESSEFGVLVEGLNYSTMRLMQVWPSRFATAAEAAPYAHLPEKLANHVYAGRLGNGDEASGDGWRYRGRGLLQITGRTNYQRIGDALNHGFLHAPDDLTSMSWAALAAAHYWKSNRLNELADIGTDASFVQITRAINGAEVGLDQRRMYWERAKVALGASGSVSPALSPPAPPNT